MARGTSELARRVLSGQVLTEREVRARQSVQIALPKASADDCGLIPVIESLDASGQALPVLSAPYFVTVPLLLGAEDTTCIPFQTAHALCRTTDLCILGRSKKSSVFTPSFFWSVRVDGAPAHQWRGRCCGPVAEELALRRNEAAPRRSARRSEAPKLMFSDSSLEFPSPAGSCRNSKSDFAD